MAFQASNTRYSPLPRASEDVDRHSSPHEHLLPSMNVRRQPRNYSVALDPVFVLRIIASILSLVVFIILVIDGGDQFIAADIFVMAILILNISMITSYFLSDVFKVTVELRQEAWSSEVGSSTKKKVSSYLDYGLSMCLLLCLIIGNGVKSRRHGGAWQAAVVVGYIVVLLQVLMAIPLLENWVLTIKLSESRGKAPLDTKALEVVDETERGSARRRTTEATQPQLVPQSAEDLV